MKHRAFLAFDISDKMKAELAKVISVLSPKVTGVKWVEPKLMHCTIRFFGDVEEELLLGKLSSLIEREVLHQTPIHLKGQGVGAFPNWRYPKVFWAGLVGDAEALLSLQAKLEESFKTLGFAEDKRVFRLHLTLGRARSALKNCDALMQIVEKCADREFGEVVVDSLTLYKSVLTRDGSIYTPLKSFPMGHHKKRS